MCLLDQRWHGQHCKHLIFRVQVNVKVLTPEGLGSVLEFFCVNRSVSFGRRQVVSQTESLFLISAMICVP